MKKRNYRWEGLDPWRIIGWLVLAFVLFIVLCILSVILVGFFD